MDALFGERQVIRDELQLHDKMRIHNVLARRDIRKAIRKNRNYGIYEVDLLRRMSFPLKVIINREYFIHRVKEVIQMEDEGNLENILDEIMETDNSYFITLVKVRLPGGKCCSYIYKIKKLPIVPYWIERNITRSNNPYFTKYRLCDIFNNILTEDVTILQYLTYIKNEKEILVLSTDFEAMNVNIFVIRRAHARRELQRRIVDTDTIKIFRKLNGKEIFILRIENYLKVYLLYIRYAINRADITCRPTTDEEEKKLLEGDDLGEFSLDIH